MLLLPPSHLLLYPPPSPHLRVCAHNPNSHPTHILIKQVGTQEGDLDSLLHKRLNAGLSVFCIAQALLLVS